jgi:hypothetical protein
MVHRVFEAFTIEWTICRRDWLPVWIQDKLDLWPFLKELSEPLSQISALIKRHRRRTKLNCFSAGAFMQCSFPANAIVTPSSFKQFNDTLRSVAWLLTMIGSKEPLKMHLRGTGICPAPRLN